MDFRNFDSHPPRIGHWFMAFFGMESSKTCEALSSDRGSSRTWSYREIIELSYTGASIIRPSKQKVCKYHFVGQKLWQCLISSQGSFSCLRLCAVRLSFCWRFQWRSMHVFRCHFLIVVPHFVLIGGRPGMTLLRQLKTMYD